MPPFVVNSVFALIGGGYGSRGLWLISCFVGKGCAGDFNGGDFGILRIFRDLLKLSREYHIITPHINAVLYLIRRKSGVGRNGSTTAGLVYGSIGCPVGKLISLIWKQRIDDAAGKAESICRGYIQLVVEGFVNIIINVIIHRRDLVVFTHGTIISGVKFNSIRSRFHKC